jgi:hypothetical protein
VGPDFQIIFLLPTECQFRPERSETYWSLFQLYSMFLYFCLQTPEKHHQKIKKVKEMVSAVSLFVKPFPNYLTLEDDGRRGGDTHEDKCHA